MGRKEWKYRWTRISNGLKSDKINGLSLDESASFVTDKGGKNDIHIKPKNRRKERIPEAQPEKEEEPPPVGIFALVRYASTCDVILIVIAIVIAILSGMSIPGTMIIFGYMIDKMISFAPNQNGTESNMTSNKSISKEEFLQSASELCLWNTLFGVALFVSNYVFVSFFSLAAANQAFRIRCLFMKAVLKQDMAWYDTHQTGDFATRITGDLTRIQDGLGEKMGICISYISTTLFCTVTGLYYGWKLALVILSLTPLLTAAMAVMSKIQASVSSQELEAYGSAGAVAEEVLSSIRTVVAFSGQQKEIQRYEACLIPASRKGIKRGLLTALGSAITWFCLFGGYALGFWYGVKLIIEDIDKPNPEYTGGTLIIIFFNVISASMYMGQTAPYFEAFALARGAAAKVYSIIERQPSIDSSLVIGLQPPDVEGHIRLIDVYFNYPSRPTVPVLNGLNLEVKPGETVALVGSSGCGKSTIVQLLLRFYDTNSGSIELDGIHVKDLNLGWLRDHIGLVGQEPVLFSTTIEENIRMGRNDATFDDIVEAAKTANAHNFIEALPMKYQTSVGERGTQLSGGQKQRIAIARALVRNPRILLLDEATSALDTENESVVQAALDEARRGRTTIVVAHRLSTIRTADKIVVLDVGVVKETGTHEELMQAKGIYYNLVVAQTKDDEEETNEIDDADCVSQFVRRTSVVSVGSDEGQQHGGSMGRQISAFSRQIPTVSQQLSSVTRQASKTSEKGIDEDDEEVDTSSLSQIRHLKLALTDWPYVLIGGISALITGVYTPLYGIILGDILGVLSEPVEEIESKNLFFCFIFLGMAVTSAVCGFLQIFFFSIAGEKFSFRLRKMVFANLISQDIAFFDDSKNSVGSLCSRLNADASSVQGATGSRISTLLKAISTMGFCIFIGLFYNWKIGLVTLSFVPLVLIAAVLEMQVISGHMHTEKKGIEQASKSTNKFKYRATQETTYIADYGRISNGVKSDKINGLSLDESASFVPDKEEKNDIHIKPKKRRKEQIPEAQPEKEEEPPPVGIFALVRYASTCDVILIVIAIVIAILSGMSIPGTMIIFGYMIDKMISFAPNQNGTESNMTSNKSISKEEFLQSASELCLWNTLFGVALLVGNYVFVSFFSLAAANQAFRIQCLFMKAVLKQDMAWYDTHQTGDFATRITGDLTRIQDGLGEKMGICISYISTTLFCTVTGLYYGWKLALVILSLTPLLTAAMAVMSKIQASVSSQELEAYGSAGAVAEEVLSSIRTVVAFSGQQKEIQRYEACLIPASRKGIKRGLLTALGSAITWFCLFGGYALGFWYGVKLIIEDIDKPNPEYTGGTLIIIFFNVISASMYMGQTAPYFEAFALARGAAAKVYSIIERQPSIDSSLVIGLQPPDVEGHIRLIDVYFNYPSRPTVPVLNGLNLEVKPGETVALVGSSGCGKSTIVQLLLRFYDTNSGSVELDGIDVKVVNLGWLRDHIGLVGQEPVLFSTAIEENIRMGRNDATFDDIVEAAKIANAHNFIEALPMKYQTSVGERGIQLSGGQKQRIAIARALVRNPRILLLDEATSALDTENESVVQAALEEARRGRTTIVVAHRLSTIRTADKIVVLDAGVVKETGTHEELMQAKGIYYNLVVAQTKDDEEETNEIDDADCVSQLVRRTSVVSVGSDEGQQHRGSMDCQISAFSRQIPTVSQQLSSVTRKASKTSAKGIDEDDEEVDISSLSQIRHLKLALTDWPYVLIGGISALITGVYTPLYGIILGDILGVLSESVEEIESKNLFFCFIFLGMAVTSAVFGFLQIFFFSIAGEKFSFRLRKMVFANLISQDIAFFDDSKNSVGSLCSRLNADASSVQGATGSRISTLLKAISTMGFCIFIGLFYNWKIGLVTLSFVPLVLVAAVLEMQVISGHMHTEKKGIEQASKVATEAIENIRTVASLHQETKFYDQYCNALLNPHRKSRLKSHVRGIAYGFSQGVSTFAYSAAMYYGCLLVANEGLLYSDLIKNVEGIMMGAMMVGQAVAFTPDYEKARVAAVRIFRLLELRPTIDASSVQGMVKPSIEGSVDFSAVQFSYPTRPQISVLKGLDAVVKPGQTVALVGSSGCGKSTCVQLLERFYDPSKGKVMVDCDDIRDLNLSSHRSHMALVSQEPVLFGRSIAENIAYGDNSRQPDMNEIIEVARQANIHGFVSSLPQGYDTPVGDRGTQLSGGQKQRIAIARALIRNPRILLLDEATSALDAESEKVVQEALDVARSGRTCLVIAHRLTTIVNADLILVLHRGKIVEKGTHQELINRKGIYYGLHNTQGQDSQ